MPRRRLPVLTREKHAVTHVKRSPRRRVNTRRDRPVQRVPRHVIRMPSVIRLQAEQDLLHPRHATHLALRVQNSTSGHEHLDLAGTTRADRDRNTPRFQCPGPHSHSHRTLPASRPAPLTRTCPATPNRSPPRPTHTPFPVPQDAQAATPPQPAVTTLPPRGNQPWLCIITPTSATDYAHHHRSPRTAQRTPR